MQLFFWLQITQAYCIVPLALHTATPLIFPQPVLLRKEHQMSHYYDGHIYTPEQAEHANSAVLDLIGKRRFFLHNPNTESDYFMQDHGLKPKVFHEAIVLDAHLRELYANARAEAIEKITSGETNLGITPPNLDNNRQLVVCNRYGGGFEICRVYPLTVFAPMAPATLQELVSEHLDLPLDGQSLDEIAPKTMREYQEQAEFLAQRIWSELVQLELSDPANRRCVVMMESKLSCAGSDQNNDFANSRVADLQKTPFALGYLFWKFSRQIRIIRSNYAVFGTSRKSHVMVHHWTNSPRNKGGPEIRYGKGGGYNCPVVFVTVL